MDVWGTRRRPTAELPEGVTRLVDQSEIRTALPDVDALVLACPLTPETKLLIGAPEVAAMKKGAVLVNIARGGVIDEPALIAALTSGRMRSPPSTFRDGAPAPGQSSLDPAERDLLAAFREHGSRREPPHRRSFPGQSAALSRRQAAAQPVRPGSGLLSESRCATLAWQQRVRPQSRGSRASRRPSPRKLTESTVKRMQRPGGIASHGRDAQPGAGGIQQVPPARNRRLDAEAEEAEGRFSRIACPTAKVAATVIGPMALGRI